MNAIRVPENTFPNPDGLRTPYSLGDEQAFKRWADWKRRFSNIEVDDLLVTVSDAQNLTLSEIQDIQQRCIQFNMAVFETADVVDKVQIRSLGRALGLENLDNNLCADGDGITSLRVVGEGRRGEYIPYSNKPLSWHTDGYYNDMQHQIGAVMLYCAQDAVEGGENALLDPEWVYLLMREKEPAWVDALSQPDALIIPANIENGKVIRPDQSGPVFMVSSDHGSLHMRYSARKRNIHWKDTTATQEAVAWLEELMQGDDAPIVRHKLRPGQGLISNNALHNRTGFSNAPGTERLIYRARYYDRIASTGLAGLPPEALN